MSLQKKQHNTDMPSLPGSRQLLEAFVSCLTDRWDELLRMRYQALRCFDVEQIHDLRVASRRLRAAVEQLEPFIGSEQMNRMRRPLRCLTRELGCLRNLDEARCYFERTGYSGLSPLLLRLSEQRGQEAERSLQCLSAFNCKKMEHRISTAVAVLVTPDHIASQGLLALLSERNLQLYRPIHELLPLVVAPERVDERHSLRIAIKKWRYFTELLHEMLGAVPWPLLTQLRKYQTLLGELNDREVFSTLLQGADELPQEERQKAEQGIHNEQRKLLQKFCRLLETNPLTYQFNL